MNGTPRWSWGVLALLLVATVWYRAHTFGASVTALRLWPTVAAATEPLDCDEAAYAYIGRRLVAGDVMYRDLTENKPPLGYWIYAAAVRLGGATELTVRLLAIPFVLATMGLAWGVAGRLAGPLAACGAAGLYAVLSADPYVFGNGSNMEHFVNLFSLASLAMAIRWGDRPWFASALVAGACVGLASLVKQPAALTGLVYAVGMAASRRGGRDRMRGLAGLAVGFVAAWGAAVGVLVAQGAGADAYEDIVRYGGALATDTPADPHAPPLPRPTRHGQTPTRRACCHRRSGRRTTSSGGPPARGRSGWRASPRSAGSRPAGAGRPDGWSPAGRSPRSSRSPLPGCSGPITTCSRCPAWRSPARRGGRDRSRGGGRRVGWGALAGIVIVALATGTVTVMQVRDYLLVDPVDLTVRYKGGGQWVALRQMGIDLKRRSRVWENPRFYNWGWQSPIHIYSGLDGVTPHFFADPLLKSNADGGHPLIAPRLARIVRDLETRRPRPDPVRLPPLPRPPRPPARPLLPRGR